MNNDLVLKLESEARAFADADPISGYEMKIWQNIYRMKFAELIIKECIDVVGGFRNSFDDPASDEIREHFGVE